MELWYEFFFALGRFMQPLIVAERISFLFEWSKDNLGRFMLAVSAGRTADVEALLSEASFVGLANAVDFVS